MTTVTFDSVAIKNPSPLKPRVRGTASTEDSFEISVVAFTDTYSDITSLQAKQGVTNKTTLHSGKVSVQTTGTKGSLVIASSITGLDGTYTNCVIESDIQVEEIDGAAAKWWRYTVNFVKDCAA